MSLAWCVVAVALLGTDDSSPDKPQPPAGRFTLEIRFGGPNGPAQKALKLPNEKLAPEKTIARPEDRVSQLVAAFIKSGRLPCAFPSNKPAPPDGPAKTHASPSAAGKNIEVQELWPMMLRDAFRIALDNSEIVRVISFGAEGIPIGGFEPARLGEDTSRAVPLAGIQKGLRVNIVPITIARLDADTSIWRLKAETMALVRSVEQQYWNLAEAQVALWAADQVVSVGQEILNKEQAEPVICRGGVADVAEAAQRLEKLNLEREARTSDVILAERRLRQILGLPPGDNRRIVPLTKPTEELIEFD